MPKTYRVRATVGMPAQQARTLAYRTRMLQADISGGAEFDLPASDAVPLLKAQWVEEVLPSAAPAPRRGRPPKVRIEPEASPEPAPQSSQWDYEQMTNSELRDLAERRGFELSIGYVRNDTLIAMLRGES